MSQLNYPVLFNTIDLNSVTGVSVLAVDPYKPPQRRLSFSDIVRTNKSKLNSAFYVEKEITVRVGISRSSRALLEQSVDALMTIIQQQEKQLVVVQSGGQRMYYATLGDVLVENDGGMFIELELVFTCSDRYGYDLNSTLLLQITGFTSSNRSDGLTFGGSAEWQQPVITLTFTSVTSGTTKSVVVGNSNTGQQVDIERTWTSGDVLVIDSYNKTVKVNGSEVEFTGAIPEWRNGFGYWYYSDEFTARTLSGSIRNVNRYV